MIIDTEVSEEDIIWERVFAYERANTQIGTGESAAAQPQQKRLVIRLSKRLKKNYDYWLNKDYYGKKITYERFNDITHQLEMVTHPVAVNPIKSLNFWKCKSNLTGKDKQATVCDLVRQYRHDEISYGDLLFFCNPISQTKIATHNQTDSTFYYCNRHDAKVSNLMLDWDDKNGIYGDTDAAAHWIDLNILMGQGYIQTSTSGTGTHQYIFVQTDGVDVREQKRLYSELVPLLRLAVKEAGFRCWESFDEIKGVAPEVAWKKSTSSKHRENPFYLQIEKGGIFAKLPRLGTVEDEDHWLDRKILPWTFLKGLVTRLHQQHGSTDRGRDDRSIGGVVPEDQKPVDFEGEALPDAIRKKVVQSRLRDMFNSQNKQQATLASVFQFENTYGRRPTQADFLDLNEIYNKTMTATGVVLTDQRRKRFENALSYSEGRQVSTKRQLIAPQTIQKACEYFERVDLASVNQKVRRAKQRALTAFDLARVWCYFETAFHWKGKQGEQGRVPFKAIKGLSQQDEAHDPVRFPKISKDAITAAMRMFVTLELIRVVEIAEFEYGSQEENRCAKYAILKHPTA